MQVEQANLLESERLVPAILAVVERYALEIQAIAVFASAVLLQQAPESATIFCKTTTRQMQDK